jgi:hypothetical protein
MMRAWPFPGKRADAELIPARPVLENGDGGGGAAFSAIYTFGHESGPQGPHL